MALDWFINFGTVHDILVYGVILLFGLVEGPILTIVCGILLEMELLDLVPVYIVLMVSDLAKDSFCYWLGHRYGHSITTRFGKYFDITERNIAFVEKIFHSHADLILLISKLTMGLGLAIVTLVTAGIVKIPFRRYLFINFVGQILWTALLLAVGYFLGHLYGTFDNVLKTISVTAIGILVLLLLFQFAKYWGKRIIERNSK